MVRILARDPEIKEVTRSDAPSHPKKISGHKKTPLAEDLFIKDHKALEKALSQHRTHGNKKSPIDSSIQDGFLASPWWSQELMEMLPHLPPDNQHGSVLDERMEQALRSLAQGASELFQSSFDR